MIQAWCVGAGAINVTLQAMAAYPNHEVWAFLNKEAPTEIANFMACARRLGANQLLAYGNRLATEGIKGTNFPSVFFAAITLLTVTVPAIYNANQIDVPVSFKRLGNYATGLSYVHLKTSIDIGNIRKIHWLA